MINKCNLCGKFRKEKELVLLEGENNEAWIECCYCCSDIDYKTYFEKYLKKRIVND